MINDDFSKHFLTRDKFFLAFEYISDILPDPDKILREKGYDYDFFRDLIKEPFFDGLWEKRVTAICREKYSFLPIDEKNQMSLKIAAYFTEKFKKISRLQLFNDILDCILFGYSVLEIVYEPKKTDLTSEIIWDIKEIVGKPCEWFGFDKENRLVINNYLNFYVGDKKELPPYKFVLTQYFNSFVNPYGKKLASILFWMLVFKKGGWKFWTIFNEKFGGAYAKAEIPENRYEDKKFVSDVLTSLDNLVTGGVAVFPEKIKVEVVESKDKGSSKDLYQSFLHEIDRTISVRILGENYTTVQGENGSRSAAEVADDIRKERIDLDKMLIEPAINTIISYWQTVNFSSGIEGCYFEFEKQKELNKDKLERDILLLNNFKLEFTDEYIEKNYNLVNGRDFVRNLNDGLTTEESDDGTSDDNPDDKTNEDINNKPQPKKKDKNKQFALFRLFNKLFSSKEERIIKKDNKLMNEFESKNAGKLQQATDILIDDILSGIDDVDTFEKFTEKIINKYPTLKLEDIAVMFDNVRYVASQIGAKKR